MADWVHCNQCYAQPDVNRSFELTNCGHIFCVNCISNANKNCSVCQKPCSTILLSSKMKPEIEIFFIDPRELSKRHLKEMHKVIEFQQGHISKFHNYHKNLIAKARSLAEEYKKLLIKLDESKKETEKLRQEHRALKQNLSNSTQRRISPYQASDRQNNNFRFNPKTDISPMGRGPTPPRLSLRTPMCYGPKMGYAPNVSKNTSSIKSYDTPNMSALGLYTPSPNQQSTNLTPPVKQHNPFNTRNSRDSATPPQMNRVPLGNKNVSRNQNISRLARVSPYSPQDS